MKLKAILTAALLCCTGNGLKSQCLRPEYLKDGDKVAVLSPAFHMKNDTTLQRAMTVLAEWGLQPVLGEHTNLCERADIGTGKTDHYAGSDSQRASDLLRALRDPEIKAIICTRGGYGAMKLLDMIPSEEFKRNPKWLVGYSDITALHAGTLKAGVMSIHGNMCGSIGRKAGPQEDDMLVKDILFGVLPRYEIHADSLNTEGQTRGRLTGGNLITFAALCGTEYDMLSQERLEHAFQAERPEAYSNDQGFILFIEDVEETMHAIDRMFYLLKMSGKLKNVKGIIFGDFTDCKADLPYSSVNEMLAGYTAELGIPVAFGFPAGHGKLNLPLMVGAEVLLDVRPDGVTVSFEGN